MTKKAKASTIVCTIILSIMVIISLIITFSLISLNLNATIQAMMDSIENSDAKEQIISYGVAGLSASITVIFYYLLAGFVVVTSIIGMIIGFINRKTEHKGLRYYNYVLIGLMSFTLISSIVKMILWKCGY